jgi:UDP-N-acetylmuramoyl-tripeptide--D-alanyl-D-alanine ligase
MDISRGFEGRKITYGIDHDADFRGVNIRERGLLGTSFEVAGHSFSLSLPGRHNLENLLAAIATARAIGISWEGIERGVSNLKPAAHRGIIIDDGGATIYDDTYNSNPFALGRALALMEQAEVTGRRIAVIGDMLELGEKELDYHRDAGRAIPKSIDVVIGVGKRSRALLEGAAEAGFRNGNCYHFDDASGAAEFLKTFIRSGDLVLIKASRGIGLDRTVNLLTNSTTAEGAH